MEIARYIYQNKVFGFTDFQYYYILDSFGNSQWCPPYRFSAVFDVYKFRTIISPFQNVEWFLQRWTIFNYNAEYILTTLDDLYTIYDTLNALYYFEWFVLSWLICTCNVECVLTALKDLHSCWMIWTVEWNFLLVNIPWKIASELSLTWKFEQWTLLWWKLLCNK